MQMSADSSVNAIFKKACIVPKVGGEKLKRAEAAIRTAHCSVGKVKKAFLSQGEEGTRYLPDTPLRLPNDRRDEGQF